MIRYEFDMIDIKIIYRVDIIKPSFPLKIPVYFPALEGLPYASFNVADLNIAQHQPN